MLTVYFCDDYRGAICPTRPTYFPDWTAIGSIPESEWWKWLPSNAQTGERTGHIEDGAVYIRQGYYGFHWPECWGRNFDPTNSLTFRK